ncbi:glycoside hydrolase superfamily [Stachybotrys elegans]|uniref:Probable glucan endo-1,3-beta-glucosidase eglC n=1 Tax=Stachybotrys elegans TaxID=80388 RepID=A0A8K0T161_9HYPO|nr:glycoside hydrolase superfamily [Stachybotrys elegans]
MSSSTASLLALASMVTSAAAAYQGFNYGSTFSDGSFKVQSDFESDFKTAAGLQGTDGAFTSARLFTMVQGGTPNDPISAIPAAISTKTSLLLGLWASAGQQSFNNEITALARTIESYCAQLDGLVVGISVGSEDLYRNSPIGIEAGEYAGANPDTLVGYIKQVRDTIQGSCLSKVTIGHVDTWTAYVNASNQAVIDAVDWVGMDAYPYFESTRANSIAEGRSNFQSAYDQTRSAAGGKEVWVTETGWPVSGKTVGQGVPSLDNARTYWRQVGCSLFGKINTWWYTLQDSAPTTPNPSFGVVGSDLSTAAVYDLSCEGVNTTPFNSPTARSIGARDAEDGSEGVDSNVPGQGSRSSTSSLGAGALALVLAMAMV